MSDEAIVLVFGAPVLVLALRGFLWWYWGIGRAIAALESIASSLEALPAVRERDAQIRKVR
jgi:hypothetical protein